ncbi:MAG TPA: hypothetical protein ENK18_25745 [Deltaproteobacteria bacterium]|nr:hypothetical protein [Deltaproteobacteria bacterium]
MTEPQLAMVVDQSAQGALKRCLIAASGGMSMMIDSDPSVLYHSPRSLKLVVTDAYHLMQVLHCLPDRPQVRVVVCSSDLGAPMLTLALTDPRIVGFLAWREVGIRPWELTYLVRSVLLPSETPPRAAELMVWGSSSITWCPQTSLDRDAAVGAVELVARQFGVGRRLATLASDAAHELLMNAMYNAPVDQWGKPRYEHDRGAEIHLADHEVPSLQLTVDHAHLALECVDPFGRLDRHHLLSGVLRGHHGEVDHAGSGGGIGLFRLFSSASILRAEVVPGHRTSVSWIVDRTLDHRERYTTPRSLYFVTGRERATALYQILAWAHREGNVKAVARIRLRTLPYAVVEGLNVKNLQPTMKCSPALLQRIRTAASTVVGRTCPY